MNRFLLAAMVFTLFLLGCTSTPIEKNEKSSTPLDSSEIACALTPDQLKDRRDQLLPGLFKRAIEVKDLEHGVRMKFESREGLLADLAKIIEQERSCCSFLRFQIIVEPGSGPITFEVTGPAGTRELLRSL